jgi:hypothetical protein
MNSAKAITQAVGAVLVAVLPLLFVGPFGFSEIVNVIVVGIGAFVVWNTKNYPYWQYGKVLASAAATLTTGLVAIASNYSFGDVSVQQWVQLALSVITTVAVYLVRNTGYAYKETDTRTGPTVV